MMAFTIRRQAFAIFSSRPPAMPWLLCTAFLLICGSANGADCEMRLSSTEVDYGQQYRGALLSKVPEPMASPERSQPVLTSRTPGNGRMLPLGRRELTLTAICREASPMGLRFDGRPANARSYRFAQSGMFDISVSKAMVDGKAVTLARGDDGERASVRTSTASIVPDQTVFAMSGGQRVLGKTFVVQVEFDTYIDEAATKLRDVARWQGEGDFSLMTGQSARVRLSATMTPSACEIRLGNGGVVDYGVIPASSLRRADFTVLAKREVPLTIVCDAPASVGVRAEDHRGGSRVRGITKAALPTSDDSNNFGLGSGKMGNVGGYVMQLRPESFSADQSSVYTIVNTANGVNGRWNRSELGTLAHTAGSVASWTNGPEARPLSFSTLTGMLTIQAILNVAEALNFTAEIQLDGLATLELVYL